MADFDEFVRFAPIPTDNYWTLDDDEFPVDDWKYEVNNGDTRLGYHHWLADRKEAAGVKTYRIVRFTFDEDHPDNHRTIRHGLTLEEAQAHCQREDTHGDGWFDGYNEEA